MKESRSTFAERDLIVVEAPSNLGQMPLERGREPGTKNAPDVLRHLGLHASLTPKRTLRVDAPRFQDDARNQSGIRQSEAIADYSLALANAIESVIRADSFPLVIGGDCSILIGAMIGAKRVEETSLLFVDGHTDFYLPSQSQTGGAAGMDLALVTGWGPEILTNIDGKRPYVSPKNVAALGNRDHLRRPHADIPNISGSGCFYRPLEEMRSEGIESVTLVALDRISAGFRPFWIHVDVDVLDHTLMPAVDSPQEDGMTREEVLVLLKTAFAAGPIGMQVTIYDPDKDPNHQAGNSLVEILKALFLKHS